MSTGVLGELMADVIEENGRQYNVNYRVYIVRGVLWDMPTLPDAANDPKYEE